MNECQQIVKTIDESLEFKDNFKNSDDGGVCKVEKEGLFYILKFSLIGNNGCIYLKNESNLLEIAKDVEGITHLVQDYGRVGTYVAILKEYAEGRNLCGQGKITETHLQIQLEKTVKKLHSLSIAQLDIRRPNIIISPDNNTAKIIDLDCSFLEKEHPEQFDYSKKRDLKNLENLFG